MNQFKRIHVEISNICNLKCSFCPEVEKSRRVMTPDEFTRVVSQIAGHTEEIVLHLLGEPLNHPQLDRILDICSNYCLPVGIVTNGVLLHGARIEYLLRPIVRQVSFSLQSFEDNFPQQDPLVYLRKLKLFVDRALSERPDLYVNFRFWDLDGHAASETNLNSRMRQTLAEVFDFSWDDVSIDLRRRKNHRIRNRLYLHFDSRFDWPSLDAPVRSNQGYCHGMTGHVGIHADGTVVPCCLDQSAAMSLGNVFNEPFSDILASPRACNIREGFARRELREDLCQRCTYIQRFDKNKKKINTPKVQANLQNQADQQEKL